ncbi:DUF881 domain-containing protein [Candidatus Peregrinibacteria bacterium]|nr:DUF881 domain-containing protein [Candidatus Peregrinibacteria bacterium]
MKLSNIQRTAFMLGTGVLMGSLFSFQSKSLSQANIYYNRESRISIFKEIQIVKKSNQNLNEQVIELEKELAAANDKETALKNIRKEIEKYEMVSGQKELSGQGIVIEINGEIEALWFTDLMNELFSAGAEGISVNGIRLADQNTGFDTMPNGQILFGGEILSAPFKLEALGESKVLAGAIQQNGGIVNRILENKPGLEVTVSEVKNLKLGKVNQL